MVLDVAARDLRAAQPGALKRTCDKLRRCICSWLGGLQHDGERFGPRTVQAWHLALGIDWCEHDPRLVCTTLGIRELDFEPRRARSLCESFLTPADEVRTRGA